MTRTVFLRTLLLSALFFSLTNASFAQYGASLQGTVRDESGAAVVGATVTAANQATGVSRETNTSESGFYRIAGLPPGIYSVDVAASTFKKSSTPDIQVAAEAPRGLDITLQPGPAQETMTVTTTAGGLETENAILAGTITSRQIVDLPQYGRDPYQLLRLSPGGFRGFFPTG